MVELSTSNVGRARNLLEKIAVVQENLKGFAGKEGASELAAKSRDVFDNLCRVLAQCVRGLRQYCTRNRVIHFIMAGDHDKVFEDLERDLQDALMRVQIVDMALRKQEADDAARKRLLIKERVRQAARKAGMAIPDGDELIDRRVLDRLPSELRKELMQISGTPTVAEQIFIGSFLPRQKSEESDCLSPAAVEAVTKYTVDWWRAVFPGHTGTVAVPHFCGVTEAWLRDNVEGGAALLRKWDTLLGPGLNFLEHGLARMLDSNQDGRVNHSDVKDVHLRLTDELRKLADDRYQPATIDELFDLCYQSLCQSYAADARSGSFSGSFGGSFGGSAGLARQASTPLVLLAAATGAADLIASYGMQRRLQEYLHTTRIWLYREVNAWVAGVLDAPRAAPAAARPRADADRMFVLLAGPGMGKTVFMAALHKRLSAFAAARPVVLVRHFFKVRLRGACGVWSAGCGVRMRTPWGLNCLWEDPAVVAAAAVTAVLDRLGV
eukprot:365738-Chlamydomonas_euryale.AAC.17